MHCIISSYITINRCLLYFFSFCDFECNYTDCFYTDQLQMDTR